MRNGFRALALVAALIGCFALPASASAKPLIAIGDQKADMFADPRLDWLGIRHARIVVPWYTELSGSPEERAVIRSWMLAARRNGVEPLVGFGHGFVGWMRIYLPTVKEFRDAVRAFRRAYPWVRNYITWNEANHCSQPTCQKPRRAGKFYDTLVSNCRGCRVVAAAVLTAGNMTTWIRRFKRAAHHKIKLWGLHNYGDVNRLTWEGTRQFLRRVKTPVWITESGGVVYRAKYGGQDPFPQGAGRAGRVTRYLLRMSRRSKRIKRIYLYHWNVDRPKPQWDSGLIDWAGRARSSFSAVAKWMGRNPRRAPALPPPPPGPPPGVDPPPGENPPPPGEEPPPSGGEQPPAEEPPPEEEEECGLILLCPPIPPFG